MQTNSPKHRRRGRLHHIDHIPGGKRFWKVGAIYKTIKTIFLMSNKKEMVEVERKIHRRNNVRWIVNSSGIIVEPLLENTVFILLRPPNYHDVEHMSSPWSGYGVKYHTKVYPEYQIKILAGEHIGWIWLPAKNSPREYCIPVKS